MNLGQYISLLQDCTGEDKQLGVFPTFVNEAVKELCRRRSWRGMMQTITFTIAGGNGSATLPATFKEPQGGANPLRGINPLNNPNGFDIWFLYSKQELKKLVQIGVGAPDRKAYIDTDGNGNWILATQGQAGIDTNFELDCYLFPGDLVAANDSNFMTVEYPMMVLEQAKVYAYRQSNDPDLKSLAGDSQAEVERLYLLASADDGFRAVRGRKFKMGGY